jgi:flagellar biosynthesis/type III secretory pathway chaperone
MTDSSPLLQEKLTSFIDALSGVCKELLLAHRSERGSFQTFNLEQVKEHVASRKELVHQISQLQEERGVLLREYGISPTTKLTELCEVHFPSHHSQELKSKIAAIGDTITILQQETRAYSHEVEFGLRAVSGLLAIFSSATETVASSYDPLGRITTHTVPHSLPRKHM